MLAERCFNVLDKSMALAQLPTSLPPTRGLAGAEGERWGVLYTTRPDAVRQVWLDDGGHDCDTWTGTQEAALRVAAEKRSHGHGRYEAERIPKR